MHWKGDLSLLLCEVDNSVANEIAAWLSLPEVSRKISPKLLFRGDWRAKFRKNPFLNWAGDVLFVELDPMRFEHNPPEQCSRDNRAVFYREDWEVVLTALQHVKTPCVIQFSTFSANNNNPHRITEPIITENLVNAGFQKYARVEADGNMMSLVYARGVDLWVNTESLHDRFLFWLSA